MITKQIVNQADGNATAIEEHLGNVPKVGIVSFSSVDSAKKFIDANKKAKQFEGFWCNYNQSEEVRKRSTTLPFNPSTRSSAPFWKLLRPVKATS